jgi:hypothetical protein
VPFICFTDDDSLTSSVWDLRVVTPLFPLDLQRSQRELKIRGCSETRGYDRTLYIDNSVTLKIPPRDFLDEWLEEHDVAVPLHSWRDTVRDEFAAVVAAGLDDLARVSEQLETYSEIAPGVLDEQPLWNGMIARRNTPAVHQVMNRWFDEVLRYSRRDQLSANYIFANAPISLARMELDNHDSPVHVWGVDVGRKPRPPVAERPPRLRSRLAARVRRAARGIAGSRQEQPQGEAQ